MGREYALPFRKQNYIRSSSKGAAGDTARSLPPSGNRQPLTHILLNMTALFCIYLILIMDLFDYAFLRYSGAISVRETPWWTIVV